MKTTNKTKILTVLLFVAVLMTSCLGGQGGAGDPGNSDGFLDPGNGPANNEQQNDKDTLSGATDKLLQRVVDEAKTNLSGSDAMPPAAMESITSENAPVLLGLIPDDFVSFVEEATVVQSMTNPPAFQVALVKCNDSDSASIINDQIKNGFDSGKWVSFYPEQSLTVVSGSYVLLAVGTEKQTAALAEAFISIAGDNASAPNIFYEGETGGEIGPIEF